MSAAAVRGIVFDFNGTLFWDTPQHELAWHRYLAEQFGRTISDEEFAVNVHGRLNVEILPDFAGRPLTPAELERHAEAKEAVYRKLCLQDAACLHLAPGAEALLQRLKAAGVPVNIGTASGRSNLEFYFEHLGLARWFDFAKIVYDDGSLPGKPAPDIYLRAMRAVGLAPAETLIFEDTPTGVRAAAAARAGAIVAITGGMANSRAAGMPEVTLVVPDFTSPELAGLLPL